MPLYYPVCSHCVNYLGSGKCQAYPDGIPEDILEGKVSHRDVRDDQNNDIVFKDSR